MLRSMLQGLLKWLLILGLSFGASQAFAQGSSAGPPNAILCNQGAQLSNANTTSIFAMVSGVAGQRVYLCGWHVTAASSNAIFQIITGTSSGSSINCLGGVAGTGVTGAVSTTTITPSLAVNNTAPATDHIDYAMVQAPTGQPLCLAVTTASSIGAMLWFSQF